MNILRRARTTTILQMEAAECGAAALAIVFAYHRLHLPLERLTDECGGSRDGTNARRILEVARRYGFEAAGFRKDPEDIERMDLPAIVHWNFDHFVVLEALDARKAWINDPERGRRTVSREEFDRSFTGPILVFRPGPLFQPQGNPPRLLPALLGWVSGSRPALAYLAILSVFLILPGILLPALSRVFVDEVLAKDRSDLLAPLLFGMAATAVCRSALTWLQRDALARLSCRLVVGLSSRYLWRAMRLPYSFYLARHPGDIAARVEIGERLSWLLSGDLPSAALSSLMVAFYGFAMYFLDPLLATLALLAAGAGLIIDRIGASFRAERAIQVEHEQALLAGATVSGLQMIETFKANGSESRFFEKWSAHHARATAARQSLGLSSERFSALTRALHSIAGLAVLGAGTLRVMDGRLSIGTLVAFQSLLSSFLGPFNELSGFGARLGELRAQVARFQDVLSHPSEGNEERQRIAKDHPILQGRVELRSVTFGYSLSRPPIVREIGFSASPGSRIALVGRTGCGKSTVARLMSGLYSPWSGEILFDGEPRQILPRHLLAASVATVEQDACLFEGTIRENLTLWDPTIAQDAVQRAIHDACLDDLAERLPGGLEARVSEGGRNFSGGERQRIEIARALARDPAILILDEATSALDAETERRLYDRLRRRGCTCVIVAHRLSAIRDCDEILVLDAGRIVERGTHETLWEAGGIYRSLITYD